MMPKEPIQRWETQNPFSMGQTPGFVPSTKPDLQSRVNRTQFDAGPNVAEGLVNSLVQFADVAADQYVKRVNKEVAADKVVQTARALRKEAPTTDATNAGYQAHAAIALQDQATQQQLRLNELAKQELTDEQWDEEVRKSYDIVDRYMTDNYENYNSSSELQKLAGLSLREVIPQATAARKEQALKREIEGRMSTATDALVNAANTGAYNALGGAEGMANHVATMMKSLQLTPAQQDSIFTDAIENTRSPELIEASKYWKGSRRSTLYSRSGRIQSLERTLKKEALEKDIFNTASMKYAMETDFIAGNVTDEEMRSRSLAHERLTGKPLFSEGEVSSMLTQRDKRIAAETRKAQVLEDYAQGKAYAGLYKDKEIQEAATTYTEQTIANINNDALNLPENQRDQYVKQKANQALSRIADLSVRNDMLIESWKGDLHALATINVPAEIQDTKELPPVAQSALLKLDSMAPVTRETYIDSLDSKEQKVLRGYISLRDMNVPAIQALTKSQVMARNPAPPDKKAIKKATAAIFDKQEAWLRPDFSDAQASYIRDKIRERVSLFPEPSSDTNIKIVNEWFDKSWTVAGKTRLLGSPDKLRSLTGLHPEQLETAMNGYIHANADLLERSLAGTDLTLKDVFPETDPIKGTVTLRTKWGSLPETTMPLSELKNVANKYKVKLEEEASKKYDSYDETPWSGAPF